MRGRSKSKKTLAYIVAYNDYPDTCCITSLWFSVPSALLFVRSDSAVQPVRPSVFVLFFFPTSRACRGWTHCSPLALTVYFWCVITLPYPLPAASIQFSLLLEETHPVMPCNWQHTLNRNSQTVFSWFLLECNVRAGEDKHISRQLLIFRWFGGASRIMCTHKAFTEPFSGLLIDACVGSSRHIQWLHGGRLMRVAFQWSCCCSLSHLFSSMCE